MPLWTTLKEALTTSVAVMAGACLWTILVTYYVLGAAGAARICSRFGVNGTWRCWAPLLRLFALGEAVEKAEGGSRPFRISVWTPAAAATGLCAGAAGWAVSHVPKIGGFIALPLLGACVLLLLTARLLYLAELALLLRKLAPAVAAPLLLICLFLPGSENLMLFVMRNGEPAPSLPARENVPPPAQEAPRPDTRNSDPPEDDEYDYDF